MKPARLAERAKDKINLINRVSIPVASRPA
jgi:hypothetical protein